MATHDLGLLIHVSAEAIGEPGQRRFRLRALNAGGDSASLWLEKEQLSALGEALEGILKSEGYRYERAPLELALEDPPFPLSVTSELRAVRLSLGLNRDEGAIVVQGSDSVEEDDPEGSTISVRFDYRRAHELRIQIVEVVAAGRPPCPLCTAPLDPAGHVCVRRNGHHPRQGDE